MSFSSSNSVLASSAGWWPQRWWLSFDLMVKGERMLASEHAKVPPATRPDLLTPQLLHFSIVISSLTK